MKLKVEEASIEQILENLRTGRWQVPQFQREFVWTETQVIALIDSILRARPIGMTTLWDQADDDQLPLEPISISDWRNDLKRTAPKYYAPENLRPNSYSAILDGRQRCTSIAMVFGGLHAESGNYRFSGKFYLNVAENDPTKQIVFKKNNEIIEQALDTRSVCIGKGLFPLAIENQDADEGLFGQWMSYIQEIRNPDNYPNGSLPDDEELDRRDKVLRAAFSGINNTKLAVYIVPSSYNLDEICEIFETLNTSGTKVSTVDLIHSILYSETHNDPDGGILLRDWLSELSEIEGAIGWASSNQRPELTAQVVTACFVALEEQPAPRNRPGSNLSSVNSVKSSDLLATPSDHWRHVIKYQELIGEFWGDFQKCTAEGYYPQKSCPYPISSAIYVGLRWHYKFELENASWGERELNALFSAFFWRNSLTKRYDQGFLTQLGTDLKELRKILNDRRRFSSELDWANFAEEELDKFMEVLIPTKDVLIDYLTSGRQTGALHKALILPMAGRIERDLLDPGQMIGYPDHDRVELHHIYPRAWCKNNASGMLAKILDEKIAEKNYRESVSNLMPLSRSSNRIWRAKIPGQAIIEERLSYDRLSTILEHSFIDKEGFDLLTADSPQPKKFWEHRASIIADHLSKRMKVRL